MSSKEIIKEINSNGGLDLNHIKKTAKLEGISVSEYIKEYVKSNYNCHGNTARSVANYFY